MFNAQELQRARLIHAQHYLNQLQAANGLYRQGGGQVARSLAKLERDWGQIEQGQGWAATRPDSAAAQVCCDYPRVGADVLALRQSVTDRIRWLEAALTAALRLGQAEAAVDHRANLGRLYWQAGDVDNALVTLQTALQQADAIRYPAGAAQVRRNLADLHMHQADYQTAQQQAQTSLALYEGLGDQRAAAETTITLGNLALLLDDYAAAQAHFQRALTAYQALGDGVGEAKALSRMGSLAGSQRQFASAQDYFSRSHALYRGLRHQDGISHTATMLGTVATVLGDFSGAEAWFEQSLAAQRQVGNQDAMATVYTKLGEVKQYTGQLDEARGYFRAALETYQAMKNPYQEASLWLRLGNTAWSAGNEREAEQAFQQCADLSRELGREILASALSGLAQIASQRGDYACAEGYFSEGLAVAQTHQDSWVLADIHQEWGKMAVQLQDDATARQHFDQALRLAVEMETPPLTLSILGSIAALLAHQQPALALQVAQVVAHHPASSQDDKDSAKHVLHTLEKSLADADDAAAQVTERDYQAVIEQLLVVL